MPHRVVAYLSRTYSVLYSGWNGIDVVYDDLSRDAPEMRYVEVTYGSPHIVEKLPNLDDLFTYDEEG